MLFSIFQAFFLVLALSLDTFTAGVALGTQKIMVSFRSVLAISLTCSASLWIAVSLGGWIGNWISPRTGAVIGCIILVMMGSVRLFDGVIKELLRRCCENKEGMVFYRKNLKIFLQVCVDSAQADFNRSQSLSVPEAISLAAALSVDGLAAGVGAGILDVSHWLIFLIAMLINLFAVHLGCRTGIRFSRKHEQDISWVAGVLLIVLGLIKLI
ncbi:manganese efflux pump [Negativibacillus massiliensis]|uniref:manganese efflux pump n=1 Tax=Negativibacillus massiliensis TaxID=1871035 RepID=UPI0023F8BE91|nr:manganese efflux pump [Negativibacillus massiliensis]